MWPDQRLQGVMCLPSQQRVEESCNTLQQQDPRMQDMAQLPALGPVAIAACTVVVIVAIVVVAFRITVVGIDIGIGIHIGLSKTLGKSHP